MISASDRIIAAAVLLLSLSLMLAGCSGSKGGDDESEKETETEIVTKREPLSTIHINLGTEQRTPETDDIPDEESGARLPLTLDMGVDYIDKFTFLCDFSIYGLKPHGMLSDGRETDNVITGRGGSFYVMAEDQLVYSSEYDGLMSVSDFVARRKPEYLLLALGASDIASGSPLSYNAFGESYASLIAKIKESSPDTIIICMSILPGSESSGISVYDVERYNARILAAAEEAEVYYLDTASAFAASNGYLRPDCDGGSSRLSTTGLKRLLELIRTHYAEKAE